jgi:hypothetical protein
LKQCMLQHVIHSICDMCCLLAYTNSSVGMGVGKKLKWYINMNLVPYTLMSFSSHRLNNQLLARRSKRMEVQMVSYQR